MLGAIIGNIQTLAMETAFKLDRLVLGDEAALKLGVGAGMGRGATEETRQAIIEELRRIDAAEQPTIDVLIPKAPGLSPEVREQLRNVQPAPKQPDVLPAPQRAVLPQLPPEAQEQVRQARQEPIEAKQPEFAMPKLPPLKDAPQGGILDVEDDLAGEFPHAAFHDRETTHANLAIDRLSQVADRLATAAERQERAALALAAATQGRPGRAVTPHKPSSRAAQLQERNAQRE